MMNKRKILILLFVFTISVGSAMASVNSVDAAKKTVKFKDNPTYGNNVKIGNGDYLGVFYTSKYSPQSGMSRPISIEIWGSHGRYGKYHSISKAKVTYKKN